MRDAGTHGLGLEDVGHGDVGLGIGDMETRHQDTGRNKQTVPVFALNV